MTPILVAPPADANTERQVILHDPGPTEAQTAKDILAGNPNAAEDIVHEDNIVPDPVPQIDAPMVSSPQQES